MLHLAMTMSNKEFRRYQTSSTATLALAQITPLLILCLLLLVPGLLTSLLSYVYYSSEHMRGNKDILSTLNFRILVTSSDIGRSFYILYLILNMWGVSNATPSLLLQLCVSQNFHLICCQSANLLYLEQFSFFTDCYAFQELGM